MQRSFPCACAALVFAATLIAAHAAETVTYADLAARITDLERLANPLVAGERVALASSYDRASRYDTASDRYVRWDANADGTGFVREENGHQVLAELEGPGCLWRIWAATAGSGHVKIYLDGSAEPAVDLPFAAYFDAKQEPFTRRNLVYATAANGLNNYTPISFQRSCRIVGEKGWGRYYQFTYSRFAPGTNVPTFSRRLSAEDLAALDAADRRLGSCGADPAGDRSGASVSRHVVIAAPGRATSIAQLDGPAAITGLRVRIELPDDPVRQRRRLRELALTIRWDGADEPAVWSPLGDFFASAAGAVPFRTLPVGFVDGRWYCFWYMPFARSAELAIANDGAEPVRLEWEIAQAPLTQPAERLLRFHAKWHGDLASLRSDRTPDWLLLETSGAGRFVGTQLHVWNPRGGWWGEGDEKFFVDGERFPSTFGTGTEDYFGYAWSSGKTFVQALHSQPVNENNHGHVSVNRWHVADAVPFARSFEAALEKYFPNDNPTEFRTVVFWYLAADGRDRLGAVPVAQRVPHEERPKAWRETGALEAEELRVLRKPGSGYVGRQAAAERKLPLAACSGDRLLAWWLDAVGDRLELALPVAEPGKYRVLIRPLRDRTLGVVRFFLDGRPLGGTLDAFAPLPEGRTEVAPPEELGVVELGAGEHVFTIESAGQNPAASAKHFAFDYLKLERVP